jgi:hypothetical protein
VSSQPFDDLYEFVRLVTLPTGELHEVPGPSNDRATSDRTPGHRHAPTLPKLQQPFTTKYAKSTKDGVGIYAQDSGEVFGRWKTLSGFCLAVGYGAPDLSGNLLKEGGPVGIV